MESQGEADAEVAEKAWQEFERIVSRIVQALDRGAEVTRGFLMDRMTGEPREIDVIVRGKVGGRPVTMMIECRDHKRPVDVTYVDQVVTKRNDVKADKAIIVSAAGFSEAARTKAEGYGIDLLTLSEAPIEDYLYWLGVPAITAQENRADIPFLSFVTTEDGPDLDHEAVDWDAYRNTEGKLSCQAPLLTDEKGETWSVYRLLNAVLQIDPKLMDDVLETGDRVPKVIHVDLNPPMRAPLKAGGHVEIRLVEMEVHFYKLILSRPFRGKSYRDARGNMVAEFAEVTILTTDERGEKTIPVRISIVRNPEGQLAVVSDEGDRLVWMPRNDPGASGENP